MAFVTNPIGILGEEEAAKILKKKGFKILEQNWRMGHLELDLIAADRKMIVFAEVKARTTTYGQILPEEYVDENKKRRMIAAGNAYIKQHKTDKTPRFDIIGIVVDAETNEIVYWNHIENAFAPYMKTVGSSSFSGLLGWLHRGHTIGRKKR